MLREEQIREIIAGVEHKHDWLSQNKYANFDDIKLDSIDRFFIVAELQNVTGRTIPDEDLEKLSSINEIELYFAKKSE